MALEFDTLDPFDESADNLTRLRGWADATGRAFHQARLTDEGFEVWLAASRGFEPRIRGAWVPAGEFGAGPVPAATFISFAGELNTGAELLPLHMISDVSVSPSHRRQGLLRRMMTEDLDHAVAEGRPLAALTVTEGSIYGRFGFGPATWRAQVEVDVSARFALPGVEPYGRIAMLAPDTMGTLPRDLFGAWHRRSRGSLSRPPHYDIVTRKSWDWQEQAPDRKLRGAVHLDDAGVPDGFVLYRHQGWDRPRTVQVEDLVAVSPAAELALWRFLAEMDLTDVLKASAPVEDPLTWALADPRSRRLTEVGDHIWLRVLDVPRALEARPWYGDGEVVLEVADPMGHAAGRWRVTARDGAATVTPTDDPVGVHTDASTLSSLYLGGVRTRTLADAGRLRGEPEQLTAWAAIADGGPAPFSRTSF
ncbi:GNAT family N-acetyltransferase [Nocardioides campestrisoli]|uniref:GNAT family N-acetyltransferase n=1 Tax=Nocardioides campestrisoli TaxID=2736757 RepID=UPI00163D7EE2|nr:GNAT family N-acetyltransferase [Nocardioides campestrisoli]